MKQAIALATAAIAAAIIGALSYQAFNDDPLHGQTVSSLPRFELKDMHGNTRNSDEWQGQTLLLNFWATWCPPCRKEIPLLIQTQKNQAGNNFQVIGIALEQAGSVRQYAEEIGINYPSLVGSTAVIELGNQLGNRIGALPYSVLVAPNGDILETHMGELTKTQLDSWLLP